MAKRNLNCDWRQYYKEHLITLEEAAKKVEPGDVIFLGQATMVPLEWLDELYAHKEDYHDVGFWYNVMNGPTNMIFDHSTKDHFKLMSVYQLPMERMGIDERSIYPLAGTYDQYEYCMWENGVNTSALRYCCKC